MDDPGSAMNRLSDEPDQLAKCVGLWANGVYDGVRILMSGADRDVSHVFHKDGLQPVIARPRDSEYRKPPEKPGDVVDKNVLRSEYHGWPDDSIGQLGLDDSFL